jgi:predicted RNA-binding Zn ribbon-like protein
VRYANFAGESDLAEEMRELYRRYEYWISRLHSRGLSDGLIKDLNKAMLSFRVEVVPMISPKTRELSYGFIDNDIDADLDASVAFVVASSISNGSLQRLKRCQYRRCRKYFFGRADAKTCPGSCGTLKRRMEKP